MERIKYTKDEAIEKAKEFVNEVVKLQEKYSFNLKSDSNDLLLYFKSNENIFFDQVKIGWLGDGSGLKVLEKTSEERKKEILSKLTDDEIKFLGL